MSTPPTPAGPSDEHKRLYNYTTTPFCPFCKIVSGEFPCHKLYETANVLAFLDLQPLSQGHALIIPKYHTEKMAELEDRWLVDVLPVAARIARAMGVEQYNILQNNGARAHQVVKHVHFHLIPKPSEEEGLIVGWPAKEAGQEELAAYAAGLAGKVAADAGAGKL